MQHIDKTHYLILREHLHELVWSTPAQTVSEAIGISDVALSKICRKHGIPRPPRGYWAKLASGKAVSKASLPRRGLGMPALVDLDPQHRLPRESRSDDPKSIVIPPPVVFIESEKALVERVVKLVGKVKIPRNFDRAHRSIRALLDKDEARIIEAVKNQQRRLHFNEPLFVSPFEQRRLKIVNALFLALERCGMKAYARGKDPNTFGVDVGEQAMTFTLDNPDYQRYGHRFSDDLNRSSADPLVLEISCWMMNDSSYHRTWRDKDQKIERCVSEIVVNMITLGELSLRKIEQRRRELAIEHKNRLVADQKRKIFEEEERRLEAIKQQKQAHIDQLLDEARRFDQATTIRSYVDAASVANGQRRNPVPQEQMARWATWALQCADSIDPTYSERFGLIDADESEPDR